MMFGSPEVHVLCACPVVGSGAFGKARGPWGALGLCGAVAPDPWVATAQFQPSCVYDTLA